MLFDWKSVLLFIGAAQAVLLGIVLLLDKKNTSKQNYFLGVMLLLLAIHLIDFSIFRTAESICEAADLFGYRFPVRFSIGPLYLLYTSSLIQKDSYQIPKIRSHFILPILSLLIIAPFLFKPFEQKVDILIQFQPLGRHFYDQLLSWLSIISILSILVYTSISLKKVMAYTRQQIAQHEEQYQSWIIAFRKFTFVFLIVLNGYAIAIFLRYFHIANGSNLFLVMSFLLIICLFLLSLVRLRWHQQYYSIITPLSISNGVVPPPAIDTKLLALIEQVMVQQRPYLNSDFSISDLARYVGQPVYVVSRTINSGHSMTFFQYTNTYRINHAKQLLRHTNHKLLAIAYDSGFSNKSSFHRSFKRITGITPAQYRMQQLF